MTMIRQKHVVNYLKKSIEKDRVSHAYLFTGPSYSGKEEIALWFVKALGCQKPDISEIKVLKNKTEILIEQIRELRRYLALSPHSSSYKTAIIYDAEKMNSEAVNALLKTLEEPRGNTVLILITNLPSALPDTIISRCEEIKFRAPSLNKISKNFIKKEYTDVLERPLNDIFKFIEKVSRDGGKTFFLLDSWLFWFREKAKKDPQYSKILQEIQKTKNLISRTNINKRLALENLVLEIGCLENGN